MPRAKKTAVPGLGHNNSPVDELLKPTADTLIAEYIKTRDWMDAEGKKFDEHLKPYKDRQEHIANTLQGIMIEQKLESLPTEHGTASRSTLMNLSVTADETQSYNEASGREALLDFAVDHWDEIGNELLLIKPQMDAVKRWMETHAGQPPPGVKVGYFTRINVRRS